MNKLRTIIKNKQKNKGTPNWDPYFIYSNNPKASAKSFSS